MTTQGLRMVYEPKYLRFFQARFERLVPASLGHPPVLTGAAMGAGSVDC
jgi:hypothetical protein